MLFHAFQFFLTITWGPNPNCHTPGLDGPVHYKLLNILANVCTCGKLISFEGELNRFFNILTNSRTCGSIKSFEGEIKHSILFYSKATCNKCKRDAAFTCCFNLSPLFNTLTLSSFQHSYFFFILTNIP